MNITELNNSIPDSSENEELTGEIIDNILNYLFGEKVHIIHPDLLSLASIFDENPLGQDSVIHLADQIYHSHLSSERIGLTSPPFEVNLKKPVIIIANTSSKKMPSVNGLSELWGSHWVAIVIFPKHFSGLHQNEKGQLKNEVDSFSAVERIYFYDSIASNRTLPVHFWMC